MGRAFLIGLALLILPTLAQAQDSAGRDMAGVRSSTAAEEARAEAAKAALTAALEALRPQADAIRADTALSDEDKRQRLVALLDQKAADIDAFETLLAEFARAQLVRDGATPEQIELGTEIIRQHLMAAIIDNFVAGRDPFDD
ncbi:hypothetical protein [Brevundimonas sp.]